MLPILREWQTFYMIVGSAAAALTGLQFVVIALNTRTTSKAQLESVEAFGTPTVVHFCAVLTIAALNTIPRHSAVSLSLSTVMLGLAGLIYAIATALRAGRQTGYTPVLSDWLWHAGFPILAYTALLIAGAVVGLHPEGALDVIAANALALLFVGIHNAWDAAVYISTHRHGEGEE